MKVAVVDKDDERLIWAVFRAAQRVDSRYGYWLTVDALAAELKSTSMDRQERLLLLRAWQLLAWNQGTFGRLWSGYGAMYSYLCDQDMDYLEINQQIRRSSDDAELLPVVIEAYEEACAAQLPPANMPSPVNVKMGGDKVTRAMLQGMNMMRQDCIKALREQGYQVEGE
ncbi:hypothetical protein [Sodalis ligni]|uniref:Uncharacterized protein n=1 Tax=Sodalis ligni TaxID=2697027 RepID=A0A4R1NGM2_9GAMM|nr:hypothetical protein [Sodalis ligni]TCL06845.1 hypothetical protein EZJ58_5142 [Sodalis ligni]